MAGLNGKILNGIINVYKPKGITSHDAVYRLRRILSIKKIGHTGTLDPGAEGVLPMCIGRATKVADMITAADKEYLAEVTLGSATDTQDAEGKVISSVNMEELRVTASDIEAEAANFYGDIMQIPPMYSAIKVGGKKLYELARQGVEIEREARRVHIDSIEVSNFLPSADKVHVFSMRVACSKGTYIRTLCHDLGERLGCHAHMSGLVRTKSGRFTVREAYTLDKIEDMYKSGDLSFFTPIDSVFTELEAITVPEKEAFKIMNGVRIRAPRSAADGQTYRVYGKDGKFLTISRSENGRLKILKTFYQD